MTVRLGIVEDPLAPTQVDEVEVEDVCAYLLGRFTSWPSTARIYDLEGINCQDRALLAVGSEILRSRDVTPLDEAGIARLQSLRGPLLVVVAPAGPAIAITAIVAGLAIAAGLLFMPRVPDISNVFQSPNNTLSDRTNKARPNNRIPDIFGTVRSIPDLLAVPYRLFEDNLEVEIAYMCVGRGSYDLDEVRDDNTLISSIAGSSAIFYGPETSPNSGDPQLQIGGDIDQPVLSVQKLNEVNGQVLRPSNSNFVKGDDDIRFTYPDLIEAEPGSGIDFTDYFEPFDELIVAAATYDDGSTEVDLAGTYDVLAVSALQITLSAPNAVNPDWDNVDDFAGDQTDYISPSLSTTGESWIGPFVCDLLDLDRVLNNFVALPGLYKVNQKGKQFALTVNIEVELTPVDSLDVPTGPAELFNTSIVGSVDDKETVGVSLISTPTFTGRCQVRARRTSPTDHDYEGTLVDEVKWRDSYGMAAVPVDHFGDVTTVHARTYATSGATSVKDRKLNLKATRRVPIHVEGSEFSHELAASDSADDILSAIARDPYIGNRPLGQVDFDNIYDTIAEVEAYFGSSLAKEFGFTFDDDNISFEETMAVVANTVFCEAYRQGDVIRIAFERATPDSVLLFNHRNILPRTQVRVVTFGVSDDHDGIELDWTAARDGATLTYDIPYDRTAISPRKVDLPAVRSGELAYWHAWRAWYRLQHQTVTLEQEATQEAALVIPKDRVLITDQTRPPGFEGQVLGQDGLDLLLSQPVTFAEDVAHIIFLQLTDATVEALPVEAWVPPIDWEPEPGEYPATHWVTLGSAASLPLAVEEDLSVTTLYEIVPATDTRSRAYLIVEREPNSNFTENVRAINYSPMYYINDEIVTWFAFSEPTFRDQSPWQRDGDGLDVGGFTVDDDRGKFVFEAAVVGEEVSFSAFDPPASYSKAAWVLRTEDTDANVLGSAVSGEVFGFDVGGNFNVEQGGDGATTVAGPLDEWHHYAATYDALTEELVLYIDGVAVETAADVARGDLEQLTALVDLVGRVDDLRLWKKALDATEVLALYRATRKGLYLPPALTTEGGFVLVTEDGSRITLE